MAKKIDKPLKEIVKERMDELEINVRELSRQTGIPAPRIYKWYDENGKPANPKHNDIQTLQEWLNDTESLEQVPNEPNYRQQLWLSKNVDEEYFAPFIPYKARAGYSKSYDQVDYVQSLEMYQIPPGVPYRGTEWRWFEIGGKSMEPILFENDIVLCSMVPFSDWLEIEDFKIYIVVWKNEVNAKRVTVDKGDFILTNENEDEKPNQIRVRLSDVKEVWKLRRQLNARFPPTRIFQIKV